MDDDELADECASIANCCITIEWALLCVDVGLIYSNILLFLIENCLQLKIVGSDISQIITIDPCLSSTSSILQLPPFMTNSSFMIYQKDNSTRYSYLKTHDCNLPFHRKNTLYNGYKKCILLFSNELFFYQILYFIHIVQTFLFAWKYY